MPENGGGVFRHKLSAHMSAITCCIPGSTRAVANELACFFQTECVVAFLRPREGKKKKKSAKSSHSLDENLFSHCGAARAGLV